MRKSSQSQLREKATLSLLYTFFDFLLLSFYETNTDSLQILSILMQIAFPAKMPCREGVSPSRGCITLSGGYVCLEGSLQGEGVLTLPTELSVP